MKKNKKILSGSLILSATISSLREKINHRIKYKSRPPHLCTIIIGENHPSKSFLIHKTSAAQMSGMSIKNYFLPDNILPNSVVKIIEKENKNPLTDGILIQLPLPPSLKNYQPTFTSTISPLKDIDGLHFENIGLLFLNTPRFVPCTAKACMLILNKIKFNLEKKHVVIIGRSLLVGKPTAQLLLNSNATISICNRSTKRLSSITKHADLLISATGSTHLISKDYIKKNATIIDVGISIINKKIFGDVNISPLEFPKIKNITPVPGGIGPITIAMLLENIWLAYLSNNNIKDPCL
ncbi:MAG: bifunctional 5,10-methylenetetrahydrofolate dehydrogenase/5,10-methenyltetrahydrofolate cyclohydrolase [Deltaproteobacteria bacterium]|nr:MAG: bifunctional 5,10-methylenetetrahydrofolate dehydrogenase/5,10-methenyltetrahydrofolate cyclohydrolase [Deltaproteobacteria bacterium]